MLNIDRLCDIDRFLVTVFNEQYLLFWNIILCNLFLYCLFNLPLIVSNIFIGCKIECVNTKILTKQPKDSILIYKLI